MIFPKPYQGIQVNYCVSTGCENFGNSDPSLYKKVYNTKSLNIYHCPKCGSYPQIINNRSVYQTIRHQKNYHGLLLASCPDSQCKNHQRAVHTHPEAYRSFGKTNSLKQRYQCRECKTVFTDQLTFSNPMSEVQVSMFYGMMYSYGVRNICQHADITPKTYYRLQKNMVDRLKYIAHTKEDAFYRKRSDCVLSSDYRFISQHQGAMIVATAESSSGYILGFDTNFTPNSEEECLLHTTKTMSASQPKPTPETSDLIADITTRYESIMKRSNYLDPTSDGASVQNAYKADLLQPYLASFAHAYVLRDKLKHKSRRYYFVEQDTMLRNAFINASLDDLIHSEDHLFYYRESSKPMSWFDERKINVRKVGWWQDNWGFVIDQNTTKAACHIKGQNLFKEEWQMLLTDTSLDGIKHYLNSISKFAQALGTALNEQSLNDWLHVYTGYYNFCWPHKNGKTPAQLLGICDRPFTLGELLSHYPHT